MFLFVHQYKHGAFLWTDFWGRGKNGHAVMLSCCLCGTIAQY